MEKTISPQSAGPAGRFELDLRPASQRQPRHHSFQNRTMSPDQTILAMFDHLDERRYDALLGLMAPHAVARCGSRTA